MMIETRETTIRSINGWTYYTIKCKDCGTITEAGSYKGAARPEREVELPA